jgi:transcriptional accessory protein Tex/SPT6
VPSPEDVVQVGQDIKPRVISVDLEKGKISLTLLSVEEEKARNERRQQRGERGGGGEDGAAPRRQRFEGRAPGDGDAPRAARRQGALLCPTATSTALCRVMHYILTSPSQHSALCMLLPVLVLCSECCLTTC